MEEPRTLPIDAWLVRVDETQYWNPPEELVPHIVRIFGVYMLDRSTVHYCCEITPSYYLEPLYAYAECKGGTTDEVWDKVQDMVLSEPTDPYYIHCSALNARLDRQEHDVRQLPPTGESFEDESYEDQMERLREYCQGNQIL